MGAALRGITVCVEYGDLLAITLPRNAKHFERLVVVSTPWDTDTAAVVASVPNAVLFATDAFYRNGAAFAKWAALEEGLDRLGRRGWVVVFDADIVMPERMDLSGVRCGNLYTPPRRMLRDPSTFGDALDWESLPRHAAEEFAGYFQMFHCDDPALGPAPWYETDWAHAGGADSFFARKWSRRRQVRPPFEVLHLGEDGQNWCGRVTPRLDGSRHPDADRRAKRLSDFIAGRQGRANFEHEKVRP